MRIVCLINQAGLGGAQRSLQRLAQGLRGRGHVVQIWYMDIGRLDSVGEPFARVLVHDRISSPIRSPISFFRMTRALSRALQDFRPHAVISFLPRANTVGQTIAAILRVPCRIASQRNPVHSYGWLTRVSDYVAGSIGIYTHNVMLSRAVLASVPQHRWYRRRCTVIYNGLDFEPSSRTQEEAREGLGLPGAVPLIVNVGRLHEQKNQRVLIDAVARVPGLHLAIAGEGPLHRALDDQVRQLNAAHRIQLLGHLSPRGTADLLRAADIFAISSRYEGLCNALVEAMRSRLPIVASAIPVFEEILAPRGAVEAGILVPAHDVDSWSRTLKAVSEDSVHRTFLGESAFTRSSIFTMPRMIDRFESLCLTTMKPQLDSNAN